ncbi:YncE family protein [Parabacteroides sp. OttesenSCG-928-N08]|nr:YncE family protein [Parabacteroides sp. OttesenSCG-928-N08]
MRCNQMIRGLILLLLLTGCRDETEIFKPEEEQVADSETTSIVGFYLLNEGNMGSNKSTLDYYEYESGTYFRNIYGAANPTVAKELGDVGNDIRIYGEKMYAVINCSNKVEVMNRHDATRIGQIDIPNCRYIRFHDGYAYVTSFAGPVEINADYKQRGFVAKVDTATLAVVDTCHVGYQPEELAIVGNKIYVANSGGYMFPNYENRLSVIDIPSFTHQGSIEVAINLHRVRADKRGMLWVSSRGDYYDTPSSLYYVNTTTQQVEGRIDVAASAMHLDGDSLYLCGVDWSNVTMSNRVTYGIVDIAKKEVVSTQFITDGTDAAIKVPYGIAVHPLTKDIYLTDAKSYVTPGTLYCFSREGTLKWQVRTGDIPAHFVFVEEKRKAE